MSHCLLQARDDPPAKEREVSGGGCREGVRCGLDFFDRPCVELARAMLGCVLVCGGEGEEECRGEVVEVEAYLGGEDRAAHSYNGRRTAANEAMYMVRVIENTISFSHSIVRPQGLPMSTPYMEYTTVSMCPARVQGQLC